LATSPVYKSAKLYELAIFVLYGRHYSSRGREVADLIPAQSSVFDLCCGPAQIYRRFLRQKSIDYTGVDISPKFVNRLIECGARGVVWDLRENRPLPAADFVIMQAGLYHFLPDAASVVERMLAAATRQVIISEPIRNLASSKSRVVSWPAQLLSDPGLGKQAHRFTEASLDSLFEPYADRVVRTLHVAGGREKAYVLHAHRQ
jgi:SAM-dependent methyltransferase